MEIVFSALCGFAVGSWLCYGLGWRSGYDEAEHRYRNKEALLRKAGFWVSYDDAKETK